MKLVFQGAFWFCVSLFLAAPVATVAQDSFDPYGIVIGEFYFGSRLPTADDCKDVAYTGDDSNIAYAADTKVAAVASAVASYNQQVEDSLGQSLPVPGALLGPALSHADGAVVAVLASALETFLTPGDVEAATVEMQVRREKAFPSCCT